MLVWRSIVSASSRLAVPLSLIALVAAPALADKPKVGLSPFVGGPQAARAAKVVYNALKDRVDFVAAGAAPAKGPHRKAKKRRGAAVAPPSAAGNAEAIISGALVKKKGLFIAVKNTATGRTEKLAYPFKAPKLDYKTLEQLATQITPTLEAALSLPSGSLGVGGAAAAGAAPAATSTPPTIVNDSAATAPAPADTTAPATGEAAPSATTSAPTAAETTPAATPMPTSSASFSAKKFPWATFFGFDVSVLLSGRHFAFSEPGTPSFSSSVNPGLRIDASLFPFATVAARGGKGWAAVAGIGVGVTVDTVFWPSSVIKPCVNMDAGGNCLDKFATSERRAEAGLRWRWNILGRSTSPELLALAEYGYHQFSIAKRPSPSGSGKLVDVGPPDVAYQYITLGVGARVPFASRLSVSALLQIHALLDQGPIQSKDEYGFFGSTSSGYGLRATLSVDARLWRGLYLGASGFYEQFGLNFIAPPGDATTYYTSPPCSDPKPCGTKGDATDQYYGVAFTLGYRY